MYLALGTSPSPFDCNMALRGLKTFEIRMDKTMSNALKVAQSLEQNPRILKVIYPRMSYWLIIFVFYDFYIIIMLFI